MIVLQIASAGDTHRYDDNKTGLTQFSDEGTNPEAWDSIATANTKEEMLNNILEMLNNEEIDPNNSWVRLAIHDKDKTSYEVF